MEEIIEYYASVAASLRLPFRCNFERLPGIEIMLGKKYYFRGGITPFNDSGSHCLSFDKLAVNYLLSTAGLPVPHTVGVDKELHYQGDGQWQLPPISYPVVAKPAVIHGLGKDVLCNIQNEMTLLAYLNEHKDTYDDFSVEKFEGGLTSYRVLVFFNKVIAVARRDPAYVIGDGCHTIKELIELKNAERLKVKSKFLAGAIQLDKECDIKLEELNLSLDYIAKLNEKVTVCYTCNGTRGGTFVPLGKAIHKANKALILRATQILNLNVVGFDLLCEDLMKPIESSRGFFIEANSNPVIIGHELPIAEGICTPVYRIFLKHIIRKHPFTYAWLRCKLVYRALPQLFNTIAMFALLFALVGLVKLLNAHY